MSDEELVWAVSAEVIEWRGPAPFYYLPMNQQDSAELKIEAAGLEYWGQIAVFVEIDGATFRTAVFPKDGRYLVPLRAAVRKEHRIELGDHITARVRLNPDRRGLQMTASADSSSRRLDATPTRGPS